MGAIKCDKDRDTLAYQELTTAPLDQSFDEDGDGIDQYDKSNKEDKVTIKFAIKKVSKSLYFIKIIIAHSYSAS